jgi:hypothetical protein
MAGHQEDSFEFASPSKRQNVGKELEPEADGAKEERESFASSRKTSDGKVREPEAKKKHGESSAVYQCGAYAHREKM